jgi:hypothetical protein
VIWFLGDVGQGRDPTITGGVEDPFGCAYDRRCASWRGGVSEDEFRSSGGAVVSRVLTADTHAGPSVYADRGLAQDRPNDETLDPALSATWIEVSATWYEHIDNRTIVSSSGQTERWRVDLVRENGTCRLCGFTPIGPTSTTTSADSAHLHIAGRRG